MSFGWFARMIRKGMTRMFNRKRKRNKKLLPFGIGWTESDPWGYICGLRFRYFKSERKRRKWCRKLERRSNFAGYYGRINFE